LENGLCWGHHNNGDTKSCRALLEQSLRDIPIDFDYRTPNLIELSKQIPPRYEMTHRYYGSTEIPKMSDAEWAENIRECQPIIDGIKAMLARAAAKHKDDAMPHVLSAATARGWPHREREPGEDDA